MAYPNEPDRLPRWADITPGNVVEPGEGKKDTGWLGGEKPPNQWFNWLHLKAYEWLDYFRQASGTISKFGGNALIEGGECEEQAVPNMTVRVNAGQAKIDGRGAKWAAFDTTAFVAPAVKRFDIIAINKDPSVTVYTIIAGNDSADAVLPAVPNDKKALYRVSLVNGQTSILDSDLLDISAQGVEVDNFYFFKIADAVAFLSSRLNSRAEGKMKVRKGDYFEEVNLTGLSNVWMDCERGVNIFRPTNAARALKAINTLGNEGSKLRISGASFFGNGKAGSVPNLDFDYCDDLLIENCFVDDNSSSTALKKTTRILNSRRDQILPDYLIEAQAMGY